MLQSLHLDGADRPVAVLLDGPALRLRRKDTADIFAPLPRLARVTVHGSRVQWRTEALLACLEAGIPVLFHGARGDWQGTLLPARVPAHRRTLSDLIDRAAAVPGFRHRLGDFVRSEEGRAVSAALAELGCRRAPLPSPSAVLAAAIASAPKPEAAETAWRTLTGLAAGLVAGELARRGVGPRFLLHRTGGFRLAEELARVLTWHHLPKLAALSRHLSVGEGGVPDPRARRLLIQVFERADPAGRCDRLLSRLSGLLADLV